MTMVLPQAEQVFYPKGRRTNGVYVKVIESVDDRVLFIRFDPRVPEKERQPIVNRLSTFLGRFEP